MNPTLIRQFIIDHTNAINQLTLEIEHGPDTLPGQSLRGTKDQLREERARLIKDKLSLEHELH